MQSVNQTRFLVASYSILQGLRSVPVGLLLVVTGIWDNGQHGSSRDLGLPILLLAATLALFVVVDLYYARLFGRIVRRSSSRLMDYLLTPVAVVLAVAAFAIDSSGRIPVSVLGLLFAAILLAGYLLVWKIYKHRMDNKLVAAILLAALSVLPALGVPNIWSHIGIDHFMDGMFIALGVYMIVTGVIDHIHFVRSLPNPQES